MNADHKLAGRSVFARAARAEQIHKSRVARAQRLSREDRLTEAVRALGTDTAIELLEAAVERATGSDTAKRG